MVMKTCTKCGQVFPATEEYFYHVASNRDGLQSWCKTCVKAKAHDYRKAHPKESAANDRTYRQAHKGEAATWDRTYRQAHKEQEVARGRVYYEAHKEVVATTHRTWKQQNRKHCAEYERQRVQANLMLRISGAISRGMRDALREGKAGRHWEELVDYTLATLMCHLKSLFRPGMSWDNYGKYGWHIDHRRPLCTYSFTSSDDVAFKECWALSNLQPLWARDNLRKGAKWSEEMTA